MSDFREGEALSPVLTITSGALPDVGVVLIRFEAVAQPGEKAPSGDNFVLTPVQARYLVERIQKSLTRLDVAQVLEAMDTVH
jgi:hypothetical protein